MEYVPADFDEEQSNARRKRSTPLPPPSFARGSGKAPWRGRPGTQPPTAAGSVRTGRRLIVSGSHRPVMSDYLLGSNAKTIVRHAQCSVLVGGSDDPRSSAGRTASRGAGAAPCVYAASARIAASMPSGVSGNMRCWKISAIYPWSRANGPSAPGRRRIDPHGCAARRAIGVLRASTLPGSGLRCSTEPPA